MFQKGDIYRSIGVNCIEVDDIKNAVVKKDFSTAEGYDAHKFDNLLVRALYKPAVNENMQKIERVLLFIALAVLGFLAWKIMGIESMLRGLNTI